MRDDIPYYLATAVVSMVLFVTAILLMFGYTTSAPTWWERFIEMPVFISICIYVFIRSVYKVFKCVVIHN